MIFFTIGFFSGFAILAGILISKANLRCRHCQVKDQTIGAQAGVSAQMAKEIEHLKTLLDRALVKQGTIDPVKVQAGTVPEDPGIQKEKDQVRKAVESGGEAFGADE